MFNMQERHGSVSLLTSLITPTDSESKREAATDLAELVLLAITGAGLYSAPNSDQGMPL